MRRKQLERARQLYNTLERAGFAPDETDELRRIEMTLHRWAEHECNGDIEREGENGDGRPFRSFASVGGKHLAYRIPDRERGALRRLAEIMARHPGWEAYHQGDPRGCALYLLETARLEGRQADSCYSSVGIAVCY